MHPHVMYVHERSLIHESTTLYGRYDSNNIGRKIVTFVLIHGGEVDGLEREVPLHVVHQRVEDPHVQPL